MADRVFDEIGKQLHQQFAIAENLAAPRRAEPADEDVTGIVGHCLVHFSHIRQDLLQIDDGEAQAARPRFDFGDAQQCIKSFNDDSDFAQ